MTLAGDRGGAATRCTRVSTNRPALRGGDARGGSPTYDLLDRVTEVRTTIKATSAVEVETYAYNALGGFSTYDSAPVDHQRPRLDGNGSASAGVPATHGGQPVDLSGGGRITRLGDSLLEYNRRSRLARVVQPGLTEAYGYDVLQRRVAKTSTISGSSTTFFYQHEPDLTRVDVQSSATTTSVPTTNVAATYVSDPGQPAQL